MRLILAATVLGACSALAQFYDAEPEDYDGELEARDATWKAAHGGAQAQTYRGFGGTRYGAMHHVRDVEDEDGLGDEDGFIDATAGFAENFARAVKGAADFAGPRAGEAVEHAKAKAGYDFDGDRRGKKASRGGEHWARDAGKGFEDEDGDDAEYGMGAGNFEDEDAVEVVDDEDLGDASIFARDVEQEDEGDEEEIDDGEFDGNFDWDPSTTYDEENEESSQLFERDVGSEEDDEEYDPAIVAFDDDDEDIVDPKLALEQEFDEGVKDRDGDGIFERDAEPEPFNFVGFGGKKGQHDGDRAMKKGMKDVFARDSGVVSEDDDFDGAYDPISEDLNLSDDEFYGDEEDEGEDDLEKRTVPEFDSGGREGADAHTRPSKPKKPTKTQARVSQQKHKATKTPAPSWGGWLPW